MLHSNKTSLAKELCVGRHTVDRMIIRGDVKTLYAVGGKKYYVHKMNHIREVVND